MNTTLGRINSPETFIKGFVAAYYGANVSQIALCLLYGSLKWDLDFLVVLADTPLADPRQISSNLPDVRLDGTEISLESFKWRALHLDPAMTEPLLTGKLLFGSRKTFTDLKHTVLSMEPTGQSVLYLRYMGIRCVLQASAWLNAAVVRLLEVNNDETIRKNISMAGMEAYNLGYSVELDQCLLHLSYACSYTELGAYYSVNPKVVTMQEFMRVNASDKMRQIMEYKKALRYRAESLSYKVLKSLIEGIHVALVVKLAE